MSFKHTNMSLLYDSYNKLKNHFDQVKVTHFGLSDFFKSDRIQLTLHILLSSEARRSCGGCARSPRSPGGAPPTSRGQSRQRSPSDRPKTKSCWKLRTVDPDPQFSASLVRILNFKNKCRSSCKLSSSSFHYILIHFPFWRWKFRVWSPAVFFILLLTCIFYIIM